MVAPGRSLKPASWAQPIVSAEESPYGCEKPREDGFDIAGFRPSALAHLVRVQNTHHQITIDAPVDLVMDTARSIELLESPLIRAIFRTRELVLGGQPDRRPHPTTLMAQMLSIGWVVLAEQRGREVVFGSVTQPWDAAPVFRSIPPDQFRDFTEPGYVKIVWTLRADPMDDERSVFHTETRVCTTDADARKRFRNYWAFVAPGVKLIRVAMLKPLKRAAEQRARQSSMTAVM